MAERWLPVVGYEGVYEVSDLGRVFSYARGAPRFLKSSPSTKYGHLGVSLYANGEKKTHHVHQLVMRAFAGEPDPDHEVRHLNGKPGDNRWPGNLEYASRSRNQQDRKWHGPKGTSKLWPHEVLMIRERLPRETNKAIAADFDVAEFTISCIRTGKTHRDVAII